LEKKEISPIYKKQNTSKVYNIPNEKPEYNHDNYDINNAEKLAESLWGNISQDIMNNKNKISPGFSPLGTNEYGTQPTRYNLYVYIYKYVYMSICTYICIFICIYVHICMKICIYMYMYLCTYKYVYIPMTTGHSLLGTIRLKNGYRIMICILYIACQAFLVYD
jgi:hypothetical protein